MPIGVARTISGVISVAEGSVPLVQVDEILIFRVEVTVVSRTITSTRPRIAGQIGKVTGEPGLPNEVLSVVYVSVSSSELLLEVVGVSHDLERVVRRGFREVRAMVGTVFDSDGVIVDLATVEDEDTRAQDLDVDHSAKITNDRPKGLVTGFVPSVTDHRLEVRELVVDDALTVGVSAVRWRFGVSISGAQDHTVSSPSISKGVEIGTSS